MFLRQGFIGFIAASPYLVTFLTQIFFVNKLSVAEIGIFASINIFLTFVLALSNWNGDKLIISKKEIKKEQIDQIFTIELIYCIFTYVLIFLFLKDYIDDLLTLENSHLFWFILVLFTCYNPLNRSRSILEKELKFVKAYMPFFISNLLGSIIGITLAYQGYGLWGMVVWKMSAYLLEVIILFFVSSYIPKLTINFIYFKDFLDYCLPLFVGGTLSFLVVNLDYIIVTSLMGEKELGIYWLAFSFSHLLIVARDVFARYILPILSDQNSKEGKLIIFNKINGALQILGAFLAIFVTFWSDYLFTLLFSEKWLEAVPIFILLFYAALFKLIGGLSTTLLFSVMRTKIAMNISLLNLFLLVPIIIIFIQIWGLLGVASGVLVSTILLTMFIFETEFKRHFRKGFLSYLSYITLNILFLLFLTTFFEREAFELNDKIFYTFICLLFATITLPVNKVYKRVFLLRP